MDTLFVYVGCSCCSSIAILGLQFLVK